MRIIGIIIEANPFHLGHKYLIEQCKTKLNPDLIIAVCSGYFTMRGEISVLPKSIKTDILLSEGFDIVLDLPTACYLNSSQMFAENSIQILNKVGITDLVFGVEKCNLDSLRKVIDLENNPEFHSLLLNNQKKLYSFKKAYCKTILDLSNDKQLSELSNYPNNTLALEYLKAINKYNNSLIPHTIMRIGSDDNNQELNSFPSGTALRLAIKKCKDVSNFITYPSTSFIDLNVAYSNLNNLCKNLKLKDSSYYENFLLIKEGINNYILKNYDYELDFEKNIEKLANKKYTKSRIRRTLLSMILEIPNTIPEEIPLKITGFSKKGSTHLKNLLNLTYSVKDNSSFYNQLEIKVVKLYSILTNRDFVINEYMFPRKEQ